MPVIVTRPADASLVRAILTGRPTLASILATQHQRIAAPIPPKPEPRKERPE